MSIFFKARGTNSFGLLVLRLIAGSYTLALGIMQASNLEEYANRMKALGVVSDNLAFIIGFALPFILIVFGGLYILGFFTPLTSFVLAVIALIKIITRGFFPTTGIPFNKDLLFFACFLTTLFAGAGVVSFDAFLDKKKKKVNVEAPKTAAVTAEVVTEPPKENPPGSSNG
jgi:uncharacterized membrane protein YphA (DoxX/SURF4 family)